MMINFISLVCMVYIFVCGFKPLELIKEHFNLDLMAKYQNRFKWFIQSLINCALCSGFWFGLVYYQNILMGCLTAVCAEGLYKIMNRI